MAKYDKDHDYGRVKITVKGQKHIAPIASGSVIDPVGKVFFWNDGVYRAITKEYVAKYKKLLTLPNIEEIFDAGLVRTELTDIQADGYGLVVKHHKILFKSLYMEWPPSMTIDIAKMIVDLGKILSENGYSYKDGNLPNAMFDFYKPIFFDLGSVVPMKGFPMDFSGAYINQVGTQLEKQTANLNKDGLKDIRSQFQSQPVQFFEAVSKYLDTAEYTYKHTEWMGYGGKRFNFDRLNSKQKAVYDTLVKYKNECTTLVDIGGSKGAYSEPAADLGYKVVNFDLDPLSVMKLYERTKKSERDILPLVMDFMKMTSRIRGHIPAVERLRSDVSLFLALVHHLSLGLRVSFDEIAERLELLTEKYCIVEFIPKTDKHVDARGGWGNPDWYTIENFTKAMEHRGFMLLENLPSAPDPRRVLVYGHNGRID